MQSPVLVGNTFLQKLETRFTVHSSTLRIRGKVAARSVSGTVLSSAPSRPTPSRPS